MLPLVDLHCHLLAGLDDGPANDEEALATCRVAYEDGTRLVAATAHQNPHWPLATAAAIRAGTRHLAEQLHEEGIPLTVFPSAEVQVRPDLIDAWQRGEFVTIADRGQWVLLELSYPQVGDVERVVRALAARGVRAVLAHVERYPELLFEEERVERLIKQGCLVQVSSHSLTDPLPAEERRTLRSWFRRGLVHVVGSDGHSPERRPPLMAAAYRQIARWAGEAVADRTCSTTGLAILQGVPVRPPAPTPRRRLAWLTLW